MSKGPKKERASPQANKPTSQQAGKLVNRQGIHIIIIVIFGLLAYSNTFQVPFQWDEEKYIVNNPIVHDLGYFTDISRAEGLRVYDALKSRYIGFLTFALNYKVHGLNVAGYHVVNLAIHLINAILVYFLALLTFRTPFMKGQGSIVSSEKSVVSSKEKETVSSEKSVASSKEEEAGNDVFSLLTTHYSLFTIHYSRLFALAVALLFVAHPLQTEAVTYVFQRLASLVGMFYLLSLVMYIKGRQSVVSAQQAAISGQPQPHPTLSKGGQGGGVLAKGGIKDGLSFPLKKGGSRGLSFLYVFLSLLSAVLAMKTKENAFTLPLIIALYEFLFFSGPLKPRLARLSPFLLTMLIVPLTIMGAGGSAGEIMSQVKDLDTSGSVGYITPTPQHYLFTQFRVIVTYLRLLFWPSGQTLLYDYPLYQSFFTPPVFLSFLFLAAIFGAAVWLIYRSRQDTPHPPLSKGGQGGVVLAKGGSKGG